MLAPQRDRFELEKATASGSPCGLTLTEILVEGQVPQRSLGSMTAQVGAAPDRRQVPTLSGWPAAAATGGRVEGGG